MPIYPPSVILNERTSARYTATLIDQAGDPIDGAVLDEFRVWLRDVTTGATINDREGDDALADVDSGVTVDSDGLLTWEMAPDDNQCVSAPATREETHEVVFQAVWDSGRRELTHRMYIKVRNLIPIVTP